MKEAVENYKRKRKDKKEIGRRIEDEERGRVLKLTSEIQNTAGRDDESAKAKRYLAPTRKALGGLCTDNHETTMRCISKEKETRTKWRVGTIWENRDNIHRCGRRTAAAAAAEKVFLRCLLKNTRIRQKGKNERAAGGR